MPKTEAKPCKSIFGPGWEKTKAAIDGKAAHGRHEAWTTCPHPAGSVTRQETARQRWLEAWNAAADAVAGTDKADALAVANCPEPHCHQAGACTLGECVSTVRS